MLQALLRGKLSPEQENLEDLLTSAVFGPLAYIPPEDGLLPLLRLARFSDATAPTVFSDAPLVVEKFDFWPVYSTDFTGSTEPDVLISALDSSGNRHLILIEVKLWSPKSSRPDLTKDLADQLAREWCVLIDRCRSENANPHLIYVTADLRYPHSEVDESATEFSTKCQAFAKQYPMRCAWISWVDVTDTFEDAREPVLRDIAAACRKLELVRFRGILPILPPAVSWTFSGNGESFNFSAHTIRVDWSYQ